MPDREGEGKPPFNPDIGRRRFLGMLAGATAVLSPIGRVLSGYPKAAELVPPFPSLIDIAKETGWNAAKLEETLKKAVKESLLRHEEILINLPDGEILIDKRVVVELPEGAKIKIAGDPAGTQLKLKEELSHLRRDGKGDTIWGTSEKNMLFLENMAGELTMNGIKFDGGSKIAGKGGYKAPLSPWDSVVLAVGKGPGSDHDPVLKQAGKRAGKVTVDGCEFNNSEAPGLVAQNLGEVNISNTYGSNLDALFVSNWCDQILAKDMAAQNCLSDGFYIVTPQKADLEELRASHSRQGYEILGTTPQGQANLSHCDAIDCGVAYVFSRSESNDHTPSNNVTLADSKTEGCLIVYSVGEVDSLVVKNTVNQDVGGWIRGLKQNDFMHSGVINAEKLVKDAKSVVNYGPPGRNIVYDNVLMSRSQSVGNSYIMVGVPGIKNT